MLKKFNLKIKNIFYSSDWDNPRLILIMSIFSYLVFVLIRFIIFSLFSETCANGDEYTYKGMALGFFKYGDFYRLNYARKLILPNYLYPLAITPAFLFEAHFYIFIKLINSLLINLSIFPVFLLAREFMSSRRALFTSLLVLTIPFFNIGYVAMTEALFLPLFLFLFYFFYKLLVSLNIKFVFLCGFFLALMYLTKPMSLFFVVSFMMTLLLVLYLIKNQQHRKKLISYSLISLGTAVLFVIMLNLVFVGNPGLSLKFYTYIPQNAIKVKSIISDFFKTESFYVFLSHISTFLILYLLPVSVAFISFKNAIKDKDQKAVVCLALGLIFFLMMFFYVAVMTSGFAKTLKIQVRYYFMIFPFFLIIFFAFFNQVQWKLIQKITVTILYVTGVLINLFVFIPKIILANRGFGVLAHMDANWIYIGLTQWGWKGKALFMLVLAGGLTILYYYVLKRGKKLFPFLIFFLSFAALSNIGLWQKMDHKNNRMLKFRKDYLSFVSRNIPVHSSEVALIARKGSPGFIGYFSFWLHYDYTFQKRFRRGTRIILTRDMIPEKTRWLLIDGEYLMKFPVKKVFRKGNYSIAQVF